MDKYDSLEAPVRKPGPRIEVWDFLSVLAMLVTLCLAGYFVILFMNPSLFINPLPPNEANPYAPPTFTITPIQLEATWTPTTIGGWTQTPTLVPTFTLQASPTGFSLVPPSKTPSPTKLPTTAFSPDNPQAISSSLIPHLQNAGCNWQGVGGSVLDTNNSDIVGLVVRIVGTYNGKNINMTTVSGVNPDYGRSGFEFMLSSTPITSRDQLYLQLLDQAGKPLSENVYLDTFNECEKNLVLVRFKKN
ncbi:MAG: hypothetical protein A2Y54_10350 [Chloroflexi bacterium RBG_16_51_16]|nr:MAG: hypothetical protein A2Y54_10350 [Chloroflexi bacterium RBG_16_51_16]